MSKIYILVVAYVAVTSISYSPSVFSAEDLDPITIESYAIKNTSPDDIAQSVTVIQGDELDNKVKSSIGETLSQELGVSSTYFAPGASRPIIRGLGNNRVRVLENGIDSLDASSASDDHAVSIEPYTADKIEVIRGPSTLRFGSGAVGGVVNIVNDRLLQEVPDTPIELDLNLDHQTVSDANTANAEINGGSGNFAWHGDFTNRESNDTDINGFADEDNPINRGRLLNSDIDDSTSYGLGGAYINDSFALALAYSQFESDYGIPAALEGDIRIDAEQDRFDLSLKFLQPTSSIGEISLRSGYVDYEHDEVEDTGEVATTFENEEWESRAELLTSIANWSSVFGFQYNDREFSAVGEEAFVTPVDSDRYGLFAITQREFGDWNIELGTRAERVEYDPDFFGDEDFDAYSLSLGVIRRLANDLDLKLSLSRSERAPEEVALFADGPHLATLTFEVGDTDLDEEVFNNIELSLGQQRNKYSWQVNAFYNRVDDFIFLESVDDNNDGIADRVDEEGEFELDGELLLGNYVNEDAEFYGLEAELVYRFANVPFKLDGRIFFDQVRAELRDEDENLPRIPARRFGVGLDYSYAAWNADIQLTVTEDQDNEADLEEETSGDTMLNAGVSYTLQTNHTDMKFFLRGENLLDEDARRHSSFNADRVPLPGLNVRFGLSLSY